MQYRLMNEYGVDWPLWDEEGHCTPDNPAMPDSLAVEVRAWAPSFNENYSPEAGWPTEIDARTHERKAHQLARAIARVLSGDDSVTLGYWETGRRKGL